MAIGRSFEEAIQKAVRMVSPGSPGLEGKFADEALDESLRRPTDRRLWQVKHLSFFIDSLFLFLGFRILIFIFTVSCYIPSFSIPGTNII